MSKQWDDDEQHDENLKASNGNAVDPQEEEGYDAFDWSSADNESPILVSQDDADQEDNDELREDDSDYFGELIGDDGSDPGTMSLGMMGDEQDDDGAHRGEQESDPDEQKKSDQEKKKSKLKTYAMIGGIVVAMGTVLGAGMMMTGPNKGQQPRAPQMDAMAPPADSSNDSDGFGDERQSTAANEFVPKPSAPAAVLPPPSPSMASIPQAELNQQNTFTPGAAMESQVAAALLDRLPAGMDHSAVSRDTSPELVEKTNMLAAAIGEIKRQHDDTSRRLQEIEKSGNQAGVSTELDARMAKIESGLESLTGTVQSMQKELTAVTKKMAGAPAKTQTKSASSKPAPANQTAKAAPSKETQKTDNKTQKASAPAKKAATKPSDTFTVAKRYSVVATYPSTTSGKMTAEKAWITDGNKLLQVVVGSKIEDRAKVTRIEGTTVYTSHGTIRATK